MFHDGKCFKYGSIGSQCMINLNQTALIQYQYISTPRIMANAIPINQDGIYK
jgi:hypothetical protein